jgi:copper oxidase (laccase) domain-containing protein
VQYLKERHHCDPANLLVGIGPSLGPQRAEFINYRVELPSTFLPFQFKENYFDFWEISKMQLCDAGIRKEHIEISGICTYSEESDFFSHRRDKKTGRNGTVVALK